MKPITIIKRGANDMSIRRYHTSRGIPLVKAVDVERETNGSVYIGGRRRAKRGQWDNYYDTHEEAKEAMVSMARANVNGCTKRLQAANIFLHRAQAITNST
jgi:hypothetical protein